MLTVLAGLPKGVAQNVFQHLEFYEVLHAAETCKQMKFSCLLPKFWQPLKLGLQSPLNASELR